MKLASYWLETSPRFSGAGDAPFPTRASVVVIGGGLTGLAAARKLAMQGVDVVVLEGGRIGGEASGRNGGQCNNGLAGDLRALSERIGHDAAVGLYRVFDEGVDRVEAIVAEEGIDCDFVRNGKLKLADKPEHAAKLAPLAEYLARTVEPDIAHVTGDALAAEIESPDAYGGLIFPRSASLHVGRFVVGLAEAAARHGARIVEGARVTAITPGKGGGKRVTTPLGTIEAEHVLLATGASMAGPFAWLRRRIVPIGSFIVATEPMDPDLVRRVMPGRRNVTTMRNIGNYFRLTADNRLIFGGRARFALSSPSSDAKSGAVLVEALARLLPAAKDVPVAYTWGGIVDVTADRLPRAGVRDGIHYATGYSGHGTQMSVAMGERMARALLGEADTNPLADLPWPAIPGHYGKPWFLPLVGAYYKWKDMRG
ncbi:MULTISPECIES: NAD(P)/FAD-dependent oxidoreductase [unclassified Sphingomonas]|uniref:NAD(P)/FAD-dependent oxidoreductase n=1 Tax=unclassified Sphingomonas TaxID=196159 RepID=UPI0006F59EC1|nr:MULTISPECIES: FAD-binding oxidoreductase [unclassified Sphingomonas]KQM27036.1 FAD-dependent oxidoreductase [Sphingomonas sp. Leaf9]KQM43370.1 FAD-dependent oxidoreductase [Sphingomonas sp. Leaf11]